MPLVIDASAIIPLAMPDEHRGFANAVFDALLSDGGVAPSLFWFEVRNVLIQAERRGRIPAATTETFLTKLETLPISLDSEPPSSDVLALSREHALSVYDAAYLELAVRTEQPLASQDRSLRAAAAKAAVSLFSA